jgi:formylglycine-generating enzyme required for sulfatase activity
MRLVFFALIVWLPLTACNEGEGRSETPATRPVGKPTSNKTGTSSGEQAAGGAGGTTDQATVDVSIDGASFTIFKYEAVVVDGKAVSKADVVPTVSINAADAEAACKASGFRLCTQTEWTTACKGPSKLKFAYAATEAGPPALTETCDVARTTNNSPGSLPSKTGSHKDCKTKDLEVYDMIGNASEWAQGPAKLAMGAAFYQPANASS